VFDTVFDIKREIERLSQEIEMLKKHRRRSPPEIRLRRYRALLNRIEKSPEVEATPDEVIALLRRMEY